MQKWKQLITSFAFEQTQGSKLSETNSEESCKKIYIYIIKLKIIKIKHHLDHIFIPYLIKFVFVHTFVNILTFICHRKKKSIFLNLQHLSYGSCIFIDGIFIYIFILLYFYYYTLVVWLVFLITMKIIMTY